MVLLGHALSGGAVLSLCAVVSSLSAGNPPDAPSVVELTQHPCTTSENCSAIPHATCDLSSRQCMCVDGYSPMSGTSCGIKLGDLCNESRTCDAHNSRCDHELNTCTCISGLLASSDGTFCYGRPLFYGETCDRDKDCAPFGDNIHCIGRSCLCKSNYKRTFGEVICKEKIGALGSICNATTQVCYENTTGDAESKRDCIDGVCQCKPKFAPDNETCKEKISLLGVPCNASRHVCYLEEDGDSQTLSCLNGLCQCKTTFKLDSGKCKKKIENLGENCTQESDICYVDADGDNQKRICINDTCQCKENFRNESGECKQKIGLVGAPCIASQHVCYQEEDDSNQRVHCSKGLCRCTDLFVLNNGQCKRKIGLGGSCDTSNVCFLDEDGDLQKSHCQGGVCQCKDEFELQNGKCKTRTRSLNGACHLRAAVWLFPVTGMMRIWR